MNNITRGGGVPFDMGSDNTGFCELEDWFLSIQRIFFMHPRHMLVLMKFGSTASSAENMCCYIVSGDSYNCSLLF